MRKYLGHFFAESDEIWCVGLKKSTKMFRYLSFIVHFLRFLGELCKVSAKICGVSGGSVRKVRISITKIGIFR
jgi:hypothetical protein